MRHRVAGRKLGRTSEHRLAMLRNLSTSLFDREKIRTTLMKAKELRPFAEKLITLSKRDTLHARRRVLRHIHDRTVVAKLFDSLAPRFAERPGGYTRILKLGPRRGDNAEMAIIELLDSEAVAEPAEEPKQKKKKKKKATKKRARTAKPEAEGAGAKKTAKEKAAKKKVADKPAEKSAEKPAKKKAKKKAAKKKTAKKGGTKG